MNIDTKDNVHPAYIETIKQLSPEEAAYFKHIYLLESRPIVDVRLRTSNGYSLNLATNNNLFSNGYVKNFVLSLDNLCRLGLLKIPIDVRYADDSIYDQILEALKSEYTLEKYKYISSDATEITFHKKRIDITDYGVSFYTICAI